MPEITQKEIGNKVVAELWRRLSDDEEARDLPATGLLTMAMNALKVQQEELALERARLEERAKKGSPLEMIDQPGLSTARRLEILLEYQDDLLAEIPRVGARIAQLLKEQNGDTGEMPELPNMVSEVH